MSQPRFYIRNKGSKTLLRYYDAPVVFEAHEEPLGQWYVNMENGEHDTWELVDTWPEPEPPYEMPLFSQRDDRWKDEQLGHGTSTIGGFGCLITSVAMMVSKAYEEDATPSWVNNVLKNNNGYTADGNKNLMYFAKVYELWPRVKGAGIYTWIKVPAQLHLIDEVIDKGGWSLARVDFKPETPEVNADEHWVLIYGRDGDIYQIADPWFGTAHQLPPAYCKEGWNAARAIFKVALYEPV